MIFSKKIQRPPLVFQRKIQRPPLVLQRKIQRPLMILYMKIQPVLAPIKKLLSRLRRKLLFKFVINRAKMVLVSKANALKKIMHPKKCLS
jgi:hypothetical protein